VLLSFGLFLSLWNKEELLGKTFFKEVTMADDKVLDPNELVELEGIKIKRSQIELVKRTIFLDAEDDELRLFFYECARRGVHPMDRLIYPVVRKDKEGKRRVTFQMGIDYLRAAGEETGRYVGQDPPSFGPPIKQDFEEYDDETKKYKSLTIEVPEWAECTVRRKDPETGEVAPIAHQAYWKEYYPGQKLGHMWRKMPHNQLAKCAEAGALRKAFPRKLGGLYINEEMEKADAIPFTPIQEPKKKEGKATGGNKVTGKIINVIEKSGVGSDKNPYTLYTVTVLVEKEELLVRTFDKKLADQARNEQGSDTMFEIEFKKGSYGNDLISLSIVEDQNAQS
jgi:phage recombination protein Bet